MLNILGTKTQFCDGVTRRDFLRIGGLGVGGLTLPQLLQARSAQGAVGTGRAKSCILLFMGGGPPQQHTFDLKPDMPVEIRGNGNPIATNVPGTFISEDLPLLAKLADKYAIVRSVTDNYTGGAHGQSVYLALTGDHSARVQGDDVKPDSDDFPYLGSAVARLRKTTQPVPPHVWLLDMYRRTFAGEGGGFLGKQFDPFRILQDPNKANFQIEAFKPLKDVTTERLEARRDLLVELDRRADKLLDRQTAAGVRGHYELATNLLTSNQSRKAFDLNAEKPATRDRYGRHKFGQGTLLARRLVEHGVPLVTVYWNGDEEASQGWDLHYQIHDRLKPLMPPLDKTFSALLEDLSERGMLDETLVVWMGEFGRAPKIEPGGGRGHWGKCYSVVFAGGGTRGGVVHGKSDRQAAEPAESPVSPADIVTTIYRSLGISAETELLDMQGRPRRLCQGELISGIF